MAINNPTVTPPTTHVKISITLTGSASGALELGQQDFKCVARSTFPISELFQEALLANPIFLQILIAKDIVTIKFVNKSWAAWYADNANTIAHARCHNQSRNWYFPLLCKMWQHQDMPMMVEMYGMWHDPSESEIRKLPAMGYILSTLTDEVYNCNLELKRKGRDYNMVVFLASAGGLLLFGTKCSKWSNEIRDGTHSIKCKNINRNWSPLIVTNPLTKLFKELPPLEDGITNGRYSKPQYFLMVDDIASTYKVVVFWCTRQHPVETKLVVYDSRSNNWQTVRDIHRGPLLPPSLGSWRNELHPTMYAATCTRGRLYLADVQEAVGHRASIRLFEVDIETGQCRLCTELPLCRDHNPDVQLYGPPLGRAPNSRVQLMGPNTLFQASRIHRNLELVECMGHLYAVIPARLNEYLYHPAVIPARLNEYLYHPAVIPARLNEYLYHPEKFQQNFWENVESAKYMPLQFYIFQLEGDVGAGRVLRIEAPIITVRRKAMYDKAVSVRSWKFSCTAQGSVIWVTFDDCLLQFDVLSGECKTEVIPNNPGIRNVGLAYRASFHMTP